MRIGIKQAKAAGVIVAIRKDGILGGNASLRWSVSDHFALSLVGTYTQASGNYDFDSYRKYKTTLTAKTRF